MKSAKAAPSHFDVPRVSLSPKVRVSPHLYHALRQLVALAEETLDLNDYRAIVTVQLF
jgi:hypothetical protein